MSQVSCLMSRMDDLKQSCHISINYVTYVNHKNESAPMHYHLAMSLVAAPALVSHKSCQTHMTESCQSYMDASWPAYMNESYHTYMDESWPLWPKLQSCPSSHVTHVWMSRVTYTHMALLMSHVTYTHIWMSHVTYTRVWMSHVTYTQICHTYINKANQTYVAESCHVHTHMSHVNQ